MEYKVRSNPLFAACGLNCGLCPRYHTEGQSRCPGCAGEGFSLVHPPCGVLSCCQRKGLEYCFLCDDFPCEKYDGVDATDSFITHKNQFKDMEKAKRIGLEAYEAELNTKVQILEGLLENYNDGRRKSFFCLAVNLLELEDVESVMAQIEAQTKAVDCAKEKAAIAARIFQDVADVKGISLKLRK
ncbi:MAG: DUF3795 domain-containing protein [Oscillospiraceae bacterium]|nr:DUF3795 domain-containing protein [Oscillospiraceae bacterium]